MSRQITRRTSLALGLGATALVAGCGTPKFIEYRGPRVTKVEVHKSTRRMYLLNGRTVLEQYPIQLGFTAEGHKQHYGDGRTPEGRYKIDRRNPNSSFYLSVGIDYPNARDLEWAATRGLDPGGDIFVHGWGHASQAEKSADWTAGCIAVTDKQMRQVYAMVQNGTTIDIFG